MAEEKNAAMAYVPGERMEEVKPGSADDPLASDETRAAAAAASGAAPAPVAPTAPEGAGEQAPPPTPATPAPAPAAPEAAPAPAPAAQPADATPKGDDPAALERLGTFVDERAAVILREARVDYDRTITKIGQAAKEREATLTQRVRDLEMHGLSDEEKVALKAQHGLDDEKARLVAYNEELDAQHQDVLVARLSLTYGPFGVKENDLQSKTVEEMELYCAQRKANYFEEQAKNAGTQPASAAPAAPAPAPQPSAEPPTGAPGGTAPAGATAPSDTGASAPAPGEQEFDKGTGREAMRKNLANIPVETVKRA